jgi:hypothetical protein
MTILSPAPPAPNRSNPSTFPDLADAYVAWLSTVATQLDASLGTPEAANATLGLIESGSNANGSWTKYGSGDMICRHQITGLGPIDIAIGSAFRSARIAWTYPQAFVAPPIAGVTGLRPNIDPPVIQAGLSLVETSTLQFWLTSFTTQSASVYGAHLVAHGRWF